MSIRIKHGLALCIMWLGVAAHAQAPTSLVPTPLTGEARMVTFDYDDDRIYKVLVRPRNSTQLKFSADEKVTYVSAGDASNFNISIPSSKAFVEVKPKWDHLATNMLVVTTRRSYHIELQSTADGKKWYTRVAWTYGDSALMDITRAQDIESGLSPDASSSSDAVPVASSSRKALAIPKDLLGAGVPLDKLYFKYEIEGEAPFRPVQIFDDGTHTYIRLADDLQELPALFMLTRGDDETALVNYSVSAPYLVVQRTMEKFVLKLGKAKVSVVRESSKPGFFARFGWGSSRGK
ncbi:MAG: hypothetical protein RLZZ618_3435 [Pseudomonadota bacterium]|jgi:type IV secretion system protein VirB9